MSDKELLELAAKANWQQEIADDEVDLRYSEQDDGMLYLHADNQDHNGIDREFRWNPLVEDADALQLAIKLGMIVDARYKGPMTLKFNSVKYWLPGNATYKAMDFEFDSDANAAARRAIVRAAAEIGKAVQS